MTGKRECIFFSRFKGFSNNILSYWNCKSLTDLMFSKIILKVLLKICLNFEPSMPIQFLNGAQMLEIFYFIYTYSDNYGISDIFVFAIYNEYFR